MPEEFEGDLAGSVFWGADLSGALFRDVDLTGARISHARLVDVEVDALVDGIVINGVDVTAFVNERDRWFPLRTVLQASTPAELQAAWAALDAEWATTVSLAEALPAPALEQQVDGEFSFVETVRHLVFALDKWFTAPVLGEGFHPMGLPNRGSLDFPWQGLEYGLAPTVAEALAVHADRRARVRDFLASVMAADLDGSVDVLENGANPLRACLQTVVEETFWHIRYAVRDLAKLA